MYLEAKETARLYALLTEKLGDNTTEAMFMYIDYKAERTVEGSIKTLATKDDILNLQNESVQFRGRMNDDFVKFRNEIKDDFVKFRNEVKDDLVALRVEFKDDIADVRSEISTLRHEMTENFAKVYMKISEVQSANIKWMFIFWIGQVSATLAIVLLFLKK